MKISIDKCSYAGEWFEFRDGIRVKVRIYPASLANQVFEKGRMVVSGEELCRIFVHCATEWEGITDAAGSPLPCTDEVKQKIYDFDLGEGLVGFVLQKAKTLRDALEADKKN